MKNTPPTARGIAKAPVAHAGTGNVGHVSGTEDYATRSANS